MSTALTITFAAAAPDTVAPDPLAWQDDALCAEIAGDWWFPEPGGLAREAKQVCRRCAVRPECLAWALDHDERGVWGGTSEDERRRLRRAAG